MKESFRTKKGINGTFNEFFYLVTAIEFTCFNICSNNIQHACVYYDVEKKVCVCVHNTQQKSTYMAAWTLHLDIKSMHFITAWHDYGSSSTAYMCIYYALLACMYHKILWTKSRFFCILCSTWSNNHFFSGKLVCSLVLVDTHFFFHFRFHSKSRFFVHICAHICMHLCNLQQQQQRMNNNIKNYRFKAQSCIVDWILTKLKKLNFNKKNWFLCAW